MFSIQQRATKAYAATHYIFRERYSYIVSTFPHPGCAKRDANKTTPLTRFSDP